MHRSLVLLSALSVVASVNNRPIIGILSNPNDITENGAYASYFAASYVKWLEAAGARVIPLPFTDSMEVRAQKLASINGALFTGGSSDFFYPNGTMTPFAWAGWQIFNESMRAFSNGEMWPLWGTCQGHELVSILAAGGDFVSANSVLKKGFDSENITLPLTFEGDPTKSRMYGFMPDSILNIFSTEPVTMNNHQMGVPPSAFAESAGLVSNFNILSTNVDRQGNPFVSSMEGKAGLPIYTTQYHPEKVQFEWRPDEVINHSLDSIMANHYLALFFVNQTKSNTRSFPSVEAENAALIYNYSPIFSAPFEPSFQQAYLFQ